MKNKKLTMILLGIFLVSACNFAYADEAQDNMLDLSLCDIKTISHNEFEQLKNGSSAFSNSSKQSQITTAEDIMRAYGYDEDFIEQLPVEKKLNFLQFDNAEIVTSYYRVNQDGSKMQLSKEDYLVEQNDAIMPLEGDSGTDTVNNGYLTARHVRSYYADSNGKYALSGNFKWSSYPNWQFTDIITLYSDRMNMQLDSEYGQISCKINGKLRFESFDRMDDYDGLGNMYSLAMKIYNPSMAETVKGLSLYISADAQVGDFTMPISIYSGSTYFQNHKEVTLSPNLTFNGVGGVSISAANAYYQTQSALVLNYTPDSY